MFLAHPMFMLKMLPPQKQVRVTGRCVNAAMDVEICKVTSLKKQAGLSRATLEISSRIYFEFPLWNMFWFSEIFKDLT